MFQYFLFKINEKPICCWEIDVKKKNIEFLNSIDWEYFLFQTECFEKALETENKNKAALAIRNVYHHSLETLFSILCSTIQAPYCVYTWIFKATTNDIRNVLKKIGNRDNNLYRGFNLNEISWDSFADMIFFVKDNQNFSTENKKELSINFANLWSALANRFLDEYSIKEYNAIKHGLRTNSGGFIMNIGPKGTLNIPERHNEWISLGNSEFGSSFYVIDKIKNDKLKDNPNYQSIKFNLNWNPKLMLSMIKFISISIGNLCNFLKLVNGVETDKTPYYVPENDVLFNECWGFLNNQSNMQLGLDIKQEQIDPFNSSEINSMLNKKSRTKPD